MTPGLDVQDLIGLDHALLAESIGHDNEATSELDIHNLKLKSAKANSMAESSPSIPQILHLVSTVAQDFSK